MKSIYDFLDYRLYLKHLFKEKKKLHRFFSHRYFLRKAGVKNTGFMSLVMECKRNLTPEMVDKFNLALKLNEKEAEYFRNLVLFNQAKTADEKERYYKALRTLGERICRKIIGAEINDYFEHWYNPVIRELICLHDFRDDYGRIAQSVVPPISAREAKRAVDILLKHKMVVRDESDRYTQSDPSLTADPEVGRIALRAFNRKMMGLAAEAMDKFRTDVRYIRGLTLGISSECYGEIVNELTTLNDRIVKLAGSDKGSDRVYQLNVQLFPLSTFDTGQGVKT